MALVALGPIVIPPPPGVDVTDPASLSTAILLFEARHFVFPFLGHALGTLVGALIAVLIVACRRTAIAYGVGTAFLDGGIAAAFTFRRSCGLRSSVSWLRTSPGTGSVFGWLVASRTPADGTSGSAWCGCR